MSIPIYKCLAAGAFLALAACDGGLSLPGVSRAAPDRIALPDGTIVAGAEGWCVDAATTQADRATSVVVLASCAAIAGNSKAPQPDVRGIVTVSIEAEPGDMPGIEDLQAFFETDAGRAALARDGEADSVSILEMRRAGDSLFLHVSDSSTGPGTDDQTWRALFGLKGRFVSVSLIGDETTPISSDDGLATLSAQVEELRLANQG